MLSLMIIRMAIGVSLCTGGCRDEELMAPPFHQQASSLVTSDSLCARVTVAVSGTSTVSTTFPSASSCTTHLVLIKGTNARWSSSTRKLSLFVKLTNRSGGTLQLPVRLYLPTIGTIVLTPAGTPASTVVAQNPDSSEVGGGRIWFIGGTGTLANNGSTVQDTVAFMVQSPTSQARLSFVATASSAGGGGGLPPLPTSVSWPQTNLALAALPLDTSTKEYRNVIGLQFSATMTGAAYNSLLARYGGVLIGGIGGGTPYLYYIIQFPDPGPTYAALDSLLHRLVREPGVLELLTLERPSHMDLRGSYRNDDGLLATADTSGRGGTPPPLPNSTTNVPDDSLHIVYVPGDTIAQYYRTIARVNFRDDATPAQISALLTKYHAQVVGGDTWTNTYIILYADPGPTWDDVKAKLQLLDAEPGVERATPFARYEGPPQLDLEVAPTNPPGGDGAGSWPQLTTNLPLLDATRTVVLGGGPDRVFRTDLWLSFTAGLSDAEKATILTSAGGTVLGVTPGKASYFVRFADPGNSEAAFDSLLARVGAVNGIEGVSPIPATASKIVVN